MDQGVWYLFTMKTLLENAVHVVVALSLPPLLLGVIAKTKALFAGRVGPPVLQPYYDLVKLLQKGSVFSTTTTWVFRAGPVVGLVTLDAKRVSTLSDRTVVSLASLVDAAEQKGTLQVSAPAAFPLRITNRSLTPVPSAADDAAIAPSHLGPIGAQSPSPGDLVDLGLEPVTLPGGGGEDQVGVDGDGGIARRPR